MAQLTGNAINTSYQGLLKTSNNGAVGATVQAVTDGLGNAINLEIGTNNINFPAGSVDFTGATVTGLPGGAPGLISGGTGTGSMKNAADLVITAPITLGVNDIAIGEGSSLTSSTTNVYYTGGNIVMGENVNLNKEVDYSFLTKTNPCIAIGSNIQGIMGSNRSLVTIGYNINTGTSATKGIILGSELDTNGDCVAIGSGFDLTTGNGVGIGTGLQNMTTGYGNVSVGSGSYARGGAFGRGSTAYGNYSKSDGGDSIAIGPNSQALNEGSIAIGAYATVPAATTSAIVIGRESSIQTASQRVVLIGNDTALGTDGANDTVIIGSNTSRSGDVSNSVQLGLLSNLGGSNTVAIGRQASATGGGGCAVGRNSTASGDNSFAGTNSTAAASNTAAFNGVTSNIADTTAVANLQIVGNGNSIKLSSPNGTLYTLTVTDGGLLTVS